jgi:hypothetical protein
LTVGASELSIQAYVQAGVIKKRYWVEVSGPGSDSALISLIPAVFGAPWSPEMEIHSGGIVVADPVGGCSEFVGKVPAGHGVVVNRGKCDFTTKAENAQNAGASFVIVVQQNCSSPSCPPITMTYAKPYNPEKVQIPVFMVGA